MIVQDNHPEAKLLNPHPVVRHPAIPQIVVIQTAVVQVGPPQRRN